MTEFDRYIHTITAYRHIVGLLLFLMLRKQFICFYRCIFVLTISLAQNQRISFKRLVKKLRLLGLKLDLLRFHVLKVRLSVSDLV